MADLPTFQSEVVEGVDKLIKRYERWAERSRVAYNGSRVVLVVFSAALPALAANHLTVLSTIVAVIVAAIAGLDAQFKLGEQWQYNTSAVIKLLGFKLEYTSKLESCKDENGRIDAKCQSAAVKELFQKTKNFLEEEVSGFWAWRVSKWRDGQ